MVIESINARYLITHQLTNQQSYYIRLALLPCNVQMLFIAFQFLRMFRELCLRFLLDRESFVVQSLLRDNWIWCYRFYDYGAIILDWVTHHFRGNELITYRFQTHFHPAGAASFSNWIKSDDTLFNQEYRYSECNAFTAWASKSVWNR